MIGNSRGEFELSSNWDALLVHEPGSRSSLDGRDGLGAKEGLEDESDVWEFSAETDLAENSMREPDISSDWNVLLVRVFTVGLDQDERST